MRTLIYACIAVLTLQCGSALAEPSLAEVQRKADLAEAWYRYNLFKDSMPASERLPEPTVQPHSRAQKNTRELHKFPEGSKLDSFPLTHAEQERLKETDPDLKAFDEIDYSELADCVPNVECFK